MTSLLWIVAAYMIGSIPTSYLAGRLGAGVDLREHGSRNVGATNVYRVLGWRYAVPVAVFDVAKGCIPVVLAATLPGLAAWLPLAVGIAAVMGHVFPVYLGFRGGKGVATAAGVVVALAPLALGASLVVWLLVVLATRVVSVASLSGAVTFPIAVRLLYPGDVLLFAAGVGLALFILYTHRANIRRLLEGTESRLGRAGRPTGSAH